MDTVVDTGNDEARYALTLGREGPDLYLGLRCKATMQLDVSQLKPLDAD